MSDFVFSSKPITVVEGEGVHLYDDAGQAYLDAGASYGCAPVGHRHPSVVDAIEDQLASLLYVQGSYPVPTRTELYERLAALAPPGVDNVWLANSGTEANEAALKFARHATDASRFIAAQRGFHGRTMGSLSVTWKPKYRVPFEPMLEDVEFVPFGDGNALEVAVDDDVAGVIIEPIQGEGGVHPATSDYLQRARRLTEEVGAALILDEIQTGLGRTGTFWASEHAGITPDVITSAKGLASGLPIGATLCADWIAESAGPHGSTFSGGPLVSAAASATLDVIEAEGLIANATQRGAAIVDRLKTTLGDGVTIRGRGLLIGIEFDRPVGSLLRDLALHEQVLGLEAGRRTIRLLPPLTLDEDHVDRLVEAIGSVATAEVSG